MSQSNGLNPTFLGKTTALGFDALHGKGVSITAISLTGTTPVAVFGSTNGFAGVITGILMATAGTTGATVTVATTAGTVATLIGASALGGVVGAGAALANTAIAITGTCQIVSNNASDISKVFITYKVS